MGGSELILGLDPGTLATGYGLLRSREEELSLVECGVLTVPRSLDMPRRLQALHESLAAVIQAHRPSVAAVESLFFAQNARTALTLGQTRGVVLLTLAQAGLAVYEYTPLKVKQTIAGYGRAPKSQVQSAVALLLGLAEPPQPEDAADAVAVAMCHVISQRMARLLAQEELAR